MELHNSVLSPSRLGSLAGYSRFKATDHALSAGLAISGPPTLVKQDVKVFSPKALRERECALAVAAGRTRTKVSHSSFAVSEK